MERCPLLQLLSRSRGLLLITTGWMFLLGLAGHAREIPAQQTAVQAAP
jgi:hypothetical protein